MISTWVVVAAGGAVGTLARHAVNLLVARVLERAVPYATATVNLIGAAAIGVLAGLIAVERLHLSPPARTFVFVGLLGGFTTFSSFMLDTLTLAQGRDYSLAFVNVAGQTLLGLAAVWGGYHLAVVLK